MNLLRNNYVYQNEAGEGGGGTTAPPTPVTPVVAAPNSEPATVLATAGDVQPHERFPEKYRVFKEDQSFDIEQTAFKTAEAYQNLEKRLGSGDLPPKTADEYKFDSLGDGVDIAEVMASPITKSILERLHAKGATNAIAQEVLSFAINEWLPGVLQGNAALNEEECVGALRKTWASEDDYKSNASAAFRASQGFAADGDENTVGSFARLNEKFGNDPDFIAFCANVGREMGEDKPASPAGGQSGKTLEDLMADPAYTDPKHVNHAVVAKQVQAEYARKYGTQAAM